MCPHRVPHNPNGWEAMEINSLFSDHATARFLNTTQAGRRGLGHLLYGKIMNLARSRKWSHFLRLPRKISPMRAKALSAHRQLDLKKPSRKKKKSLWCNLEAGLSCPGITAAASEASG